MYDSNRTRRWMLRTMGATVAGAAVIGNASADEHIIREEAELTDEAHGLDTGASGHATFEINPEEGIVEYEVHIDRICDPTQAHVHMGGPDEAGPVVTWLYPEDQQEPRHIEGFFSGTLAEGTITPADFVGPLEGLSFEEAAARLEEEGAYVNVHTEEHPRGEIRGQIEPVEPSRDGDEGEEEDEEPEDGDPQLALGDLYIGSGVSAEEEYIELVNVGEEPIDFTGWTLEDRLGEGVITGVREDPWTFPDGLTLEPDEVLTIYSREGETSIEDLVWSLDYGDHIWRQDADDRVVVRDADGNIVFEGEYDTEDVIDANEAS